LKRERSSGPGSLRGNAWRDAARTVLTPLVKALLERGFRYTDMVRLVGEAAVRAALEAGDLADAELCKRTGVPRGVVRRLRAGAESALCPVLPYAAATRLLSRWLTGAEFSEAGKPKVLPLHGPRSFARLAGMSGVDPATALPALERAGVVRVAKGRAALCKDAYVPSRGEVEMLDILGRDGGEFLHTMIHNMQASPGRAMFQRKTSYDNIGSVAMKDLRAALREQAMCALLAADRTLAANDRDRNASAAGGKRTRVSFGVYVAEEPVKTQRRSPSTSARRRKR
jgi:hypothetical protein